MLPILVKGWRNEYFVELSALSSYRALKNVLETPYSLSTPKSNDCTVQNGLEGLSRCVVLVCQLVALRHARMDVMIRQSALNVLIHFSIVCWAASLAGISGNKAVAGGSLPGLYNLPIDGLIDKSVRSLIC